MYSKNNWVLRSKKPDEHTQHAERERHTDTENMHDKLLKHDELVGYYNRVNKKEKRNCLISEEFDKYEAKKLYPSKNVIKDELGSPSNNSQDEDSYSILHHSMDLDDDIKSEACSHISNGSFRGSLDSSYNLVKKKHNETYMSTDYSIDYNLNSTRNLDVFNNEILTEVKSSPHKKKKKNITDHHQKVATISNTTDLGKKLTRKTLDISEEFVQEASDLNCDKPKLTGSQDCLKIKMKQTKNEKLENFGDNNEIMKPDMTSEDDLNTTNNFIIKDYNLKKFAGLSEFNSEVEGVELTSPHRKKKKRKHLDETGINGDATSNEIFDINNELNKSELKVFEEVIQSHQSTENGKYLKKKKHKKFDDSVESTINNKSCEENLNTVISPKKNTKTNPIESDFFNHLPSYNLNVTEVQLPKFNSEDEKGIVLASPHRKKKKKKHFDETGINGDETLINIDNELSKSEVFEEVVQSHHSTLNDKYLKKKKHKKFDGSVELTINNKACEENLYTVICPKKNKKTNSIETNFSNHSPKYLNKSVLLSEFNSDVKTGVELSSPHRKKKKKKHLDETGINGDATSNEISDENNDLSKSEVFDEVLQSNNSIELDKKLKKKKHKNFYDSVKLIVNNNASEENLNTDICVKKKKKKILNETYLPNYSPNYNINNSVGMPEFNSEVEKGVELSPKKKKSKKHLDETLSINEDSSNQMLNTTNNLIERGVFEEASYFNSSTEIAKKSKKKKHKIFDNSDEVVIDEACENDLNTNIYLKKKQKTRRNNITDHSLDLNESNYQIRNDAELPSPHKKKKENYLKKTISLNSDICLDVVSDKKPNVKNSETYVEDTYLNNSNESQKKSKKNKHKMSKHLEHDMKIKLLEENNDNTETKQGDFLLEKTNNSVKNKKNKFFEKEKTIEGSEIGNMLLRTDLNSEFKNQKDNQEFIKKRIIIEEDDEGNHFGSERHVKKTKRKKQIDHEKDEEIKTCNTTSSKREKFCNSEEKEKLVPIIYRETDVDLENQLKIKESKKKHEKKKKHEECEIDSTTFKIVKKPSKGSDVVSNSSYTENNLKQKKSKNYKREKLVEENEMNYSNLDLIKRNEMINGKIDDDMVTKEKNLDLGIYSKKKRKKMKDVDNEIKESNIDQFTVKLDLHVQLDRKRHKDLHSTCTVGEPELNLERHLKKKKKLKKLPHCEKLFDENEIDSSNLKYELYNGNLHKNKLPKTKKQCFEEENKEIDLDFETNRQKNKNKKRHNEKSNVKHETDYLLSENAHQKKVFEKNKKKYDKKVADFQLGTNFKKIKRHSVSDELNVEYDNNDFTLENIKNNESFHEKNSLNWVNEDLCTEGKFYKKKPKKRYSDSDKSNLEHENDYSMLQNVKNENLVEQNGFEECNIVEELDTEENLNNETRHSSGKREIDLILKTKHNIRNKKLEVGELILKTEPIDESEISQFSKNYEKVDDLIPKKKKSVNKVNSKSKIEKNYRKRLNSDKISESDLEYKTFKDNLNSELKPRKKRKIRNASIIANGTLLSREENGLVKDDNFHEDYLTRRSSLRDDSNLEITTRVSERKVSKKNVAQELARFAAKLQLVDDDLKNFDNFHSFLDVTDREFESTEEEFEKLMGLYIRLPWIVPELHMIETRVALRPTDEQRQRIKALGVNLRTGPYTKEEDEKIKSNFEKFCEDHNLPMDPTCFLSFKHPNLQCVLPLEERRKFVRYLAHGLNSRLLCSVYNRFKRLFNTYRYGRFSKKEDEVILKYLSKHSNNRTPYSDLAKLLHRDKFAIERRCILLLKQFKTKTIPVNWDTERIKEFMKHFMEVLNVEDVESIRNKKINLQKWEEMSRRMNIPADTLRNAWIFKISNFVLNKRTIVGPMIKALLTQLLMERGESDWKTVDWHAISKKIRKKSILPHKLKSMAMQIVFDYVPEEIRNDLKKSLSFLENNLNIIFSEPTGDFNKTRN